MAAKKKPTKSPRTNRKLDIDVAEVERLAGLGLTQEEIALSLGVADRTLYSRKVENADFADAIKRGKAQANGLVSNVLFELCKAGNVTAIIWYEKTRRGLTDKISLDLTKLTDEQLAALVGGADQAGSQD